MTVKGDGNFDRVSSPVLTSAEQWKAYTPTSSFKPSDSSGYKGKKLFEQPIIPLDASIKEVPPLVFSYFDTRKEKYITMQTRPIKVKVKADTRQARALSSRDSDGNKLPGQASDSSGLSKKPEGLAPIHVGQGTVTASLKPIFQNTWFIGVQGIPLGALFIGLFLGRRNRRLSNDPGHIETKKGQAEDQQIHQGDGQEHSRPRCSWIFQRLQVYGPGTAGGDMVTGAGDYYSCRGERSSQQKCGRGQACF